MSDPAMQRDSLLGLSAGGFHRMTYTEWGRAGAARTVVCVHGMTRNGRDFDALAGALAEAGWRVVCPDVVGRGLSDRLPEPAAYGFPQYLADMTALIARLDVAEVDFVGTSMGGLIGFMMAALPGTPVRRLVINDVGPFIPAAALERIHTYLGGDPVFPDLTAAETYFRQVHAPFGALTDHQWRHLTEHSLRPVEPGAYRLAYDPRIALRDKETPVEDVDLWAQWDAVACPVLVLRGANSDLLLAETASEMSRRGPRAQVVEIEGCGHAPALMAADQIGLVVDWLIQDQSRP
jgi:pimeloyl-ACP methyl ester carboxylesterase